MLFDQEYPLATHHAISRHQDIKNKVGGGDFATIFCTEGAQFLTWVDPKELIEQRADASAGVSGMSAETTGDSAEERGAALTLDAKETRG